MQRTRVKICGLTNAEDVRAAVDAGADAVGVILAPSPRRVSVEQAAVALADVPPFVARVGVFVDEEPAVVADAVARLRLSAVQFHGRETPEACQTAPAPVVKTFAVGTEFVTEVMEPFRQRVAALLLDTLDPQVAGGTGRTFDWNALATLPGWAPTLLAGGLTPDNVSQAIKQVEPFAVDVSSGVEAEPGRKDHQKLYDLFAAIAEADAERRS